MEVIVALDDFVTNKGKTKDIFILKGYAGTGKTTLIATLSTILATFGFKFVLLAPTGRAAKVMASYSTKNAYTIHKHIYIKEEAESGDLIFRLKENLAAKTIYIVDEASMISDETGIGERGLLADLFEFVFTKKSNKLFIVGDTAQLPPVRQNTSPALDADILRERFDADVVEMELTEVVRQAARSGILENATGIRNQIRLNVPNIKLSVKGFPDMYRMTGEKLEEGINYAYSKFGVRNTMIITRSNRDAVAYNKYIRQRINWCEEEIQNGDLLIAVRNNYEVLPEEMHAGFLANGDFIEVVKVKHVEECHGFRFAEMTLKMVDEVGEPEFEAKILLDLLYSNAPSLSQEENQRLYHAVLDDYQEIKGRRERKSAVKKDPFLNAVQVKFAYALTCHKAQGGQWDAVFINQGFLPDDNIDIDYLRWLYTAITRGTKEVFLVNFNPTFFNLG